MQMKNMYTYFKIAAGNPNLFVPRDVTKMKWSTFATDAAWKVIVSKANLTPIIKKNSIKQ